MFETNQALPSEHSRAFIFFMRDVYLSMMLASRGITGGGQGARQSAVSAMMCSLLRLGCAA